MPQKIEFTKTEKAPNFRSRDKYVAAKQIRTTTVTALVTNAGFCFPLIVGIKDTVNIQLPTENTKSCQFIIPSRYH